MVFNSVEALTVYSYYCRLRHKGVRIYFVYQFEDKARLAALSNAEYHFDVLLCEEAATVEYRATTVGNLVDGFINLLIFIPNRSLEKVSCHFLMTAIRKIALYMLDS